MESISIIIPSYGLSDIRRLKLTTESIFAQKQVNIELIVSGTSEARKIRDVSEVDIFKETKFEGEISTGKIINRALKIAEGNYVYVSDADLVFKCQTFFKNLTEISKSLRGVALKRPFMRRLLLEDFKSFYKLATELGLASIIRRFDCSQDYVIKPFGTNRPMKSFPKFENGRQKIFIASERDFHEYVRDEKNKGFEPKFFSQERHCGSTFTPTKAIREIGGYCENFISWGIWDADVQWKLDSTIGMNLIPESEDFEIIHLDHPKGYFDKEKWNRDKELQRIRRCQGYKISIEQDRFVYFGGIND